MSVRDWVTLSIRLAGFGFVLFGTAKLVAAVELAQSSPVRLMEKMSPNEGLGDLLAPSYLPVMLWGLVGLALIALSSAISRLLLVGLNRGDRRPSPGLAGDRW